VSYTFVTEVEIKIGYHVQVVHRPDANDEVYIVRGLRTIGATAFAEVESVGTGNTRFLPVCFLNPEYEWLRAYLIDLSGELSTEA